MDVTDASQTDPSSAFRWADIGRLRSVPLREVWPHEAHDFTMWLEENIEVVGDQIGLTISDVRRELAAGSFSVDLVGVDEHERTVVIENQLEKSDHDHLGKLITYLAMHEASVAVWIVREPRPEHVAAVTWLNKSRDVSFYVFKIEAVRIGDSPAAPVLTLITGPTEELREAGDVERQKVERHYEHQAFWTGLLESATGRPHTHSTISPGYENWLGAGAGVSGVAFHYRVRKSDADVHVLIQGPDKEKNEWIFDQLFERRTEIEQAYGDELIWDRKDEVKKCEILAASWPTGINDRDAWPALHAEMVDRMSRLAAAVQPVLQGLR